MVKCHPDGENRFRVVFDRPFSAVAPILCFIVGYYGSAVLTSATARVDPSLRLDLLAPCVPALVWVYLGGIVLPFAPILLLPRRLLSKAALAYIFVLGAATIAFFTIPTDGTLLRASCIEPSWPLVLVYQLDPPTNMLPSLHVALCTLAYFCLKLSDSPWRRTAAVLAAAQAFAALLIKQHTLIDVATGATLGWIAYRIVLARSATLTSLEHQSSAPVE